MHPSPFVFDRRTFLKVIAAGGGATAIGALAAGLGARQALGQASPAGADAITALADSLEYDPARIFRYMADEIRYEPYAGTLRGAAGTLTARAGNSVDQSLLLAALLEAALIPTRFVAGRLDDASAQGLLASAIVDRATLHATAEDILVGSAGQAGAPRPATDPDLQAYIDAARPDLDRLASVAERQLRDSLQDVVGSLDAQGVVSDVPFTPIPDLERARHMWVQARRGAVWDDLDPSLPGWIQAVATPPAAVSPPAASASGAASEVPVSASAAPPSPAPAPSGAPFSAVPDDLAHQVRFIVEIESITGGQLGREVTLDRTARAADVAGAPVSFLNVKPSGFEGLGLGIGSALEGTVTWNPVLAMGGDVVIGRVPVVLGTQGGGALDLGDGGGGPGEGETVAQWLEVQVLSPGSDPIVSRRTIFDRIGPAARAAGAVSVADVGPVELQDLDEETKQAYLPLLAVHAFAITGGPLPGSALSGPVDAESIGTTTVPGLAYHLLRDALSDVVAVDMGVRAFHDAPNVVSWSLGAAAPAGDEPTRLVAVDIWHRSFGVLPVADVAPSVPPSVVAGVLSHVAERIAMRDLGDDPSTATALGVGVLFDVARDLGIGLRVMTEPPTDDRYPAATRERIGAAIMTGATVIAPERPITVNGVPRLGWWAFDQATGRTWDELDDGRGTEMVEAQMELSISRRAAYCLLALGEKIVAAAAITAGLLGAPRGATAGLGFLAIALWIFNFFNPGFAGGCRAGSIPVQLPVVP